MKYVPKDITNEVAESFLALFSEKITKWLKNETDDTFCIGDDQYQLVWNSGRNSYEVWLDGELLAWNDNIKDFLNVGWFIFSNKASYNNIRNLSNLKAITVLNDGETWTDLKDTKVVLLSNDFEYDMIYEANDLYDESLVLVDGTNVGDFIIEEISIPQLVEFYLANRS